MAERPLFDPLRTRPPEEGEKPAQTRPLRVRELNELIRGAIARHVPESVPVLGEIGEISRAASGHLYFTIKDDDSELRCVMWKSQAARLRFVPQTGPEVLAVGGVEVYAPRGTVQLIVRTLEPRGVGALELAFRQLREKLEREGLFDERRKRPLPPFPRRIALITSPAGAALHDMLHALARRFPVAEALLFPVRVQGEGAAPEIAAALTLCNQPEATWGEIDVVVVARGGGSLEDLWAFNEEAVARAIAASAIPVVSGVGHEVDVTIADLVADLRAPTPTAAIELITPNGPDLMAWLLRQRERLTKIISQELSLQRAHLTRLLDREPLRLPTARLRERGQRIDEWQQSLRVALLERFRAWRLRLHTAEARLLRLGGGAWTSAARRRLDERLRRAWQALLHRLFGTRARLSRLEGRLQDASPHWQARSHAERVAHLLARCHAALVARLRLERERLDGRMAELSACDPRRVLERGYSLVRDAATRTVIRSRQAVRDGQRLLIETADGEYRAKADDPRQRRLFE